jgi:hypothetical protein
MSDDYDLEDIIDDLGAEMSVMVRKTIKAAIENGWLLNKPGMTVALRLDHPTMKDAYPVYIAWALAKTPTGKLSWRFSSCGTKSLVPLSGAELIEYLADPTLVMPSDDPLVCGSHLCDAKEVWVWKGGGTYCEKHAKHMLTAVDFAKGHFGPPSEYDPDDPPPWDDDKEPLENLQTALGATTVIDMGVTPSPTPGPPLRVSAPPLRIQAPSLPSS